MNTHVILADIGRAVVISGVFLGAIWGYLRLKGAPGEEKTLFYRKNLIGIFCFSMGVSMYASDSLAGGIFIGIAYVVCFCVLCRLDKRNT